MEEAEEEEDRGPGRGLNIQILIRKQTANSCSPLPLKPTDCKLDPGLLHPCNEGQTPGRDAQVPVQSSAS